MYNLAMQSGSSSRIRIHIVLGKGKGTLLEGRKTAMCLSQGISRHLFGKRTQPFISLASITMHKPKTFWNVKTVHFDIFKMKHFNVVLKGFCQFCFYSDYLSNSFSHSETSLFRNKCYPDFFFFSFSLSFDFQMA